VTTAADANGSILIKQNNFAIYANIGATGKTFDTVSLENAAVITAKLMDGKSIFANGGVSLSHAAAGLNNVLELYNDTA